LGSVRAVTAAGAERLEATGIVCPEQTRALTAPTALARAEAELESLANEGVRLVTMDDAEYPPGLLILPDPPLALWAAGRLEAQFDKCIAIVGTRSPDAAAERLARDLAGALVQSGRVIVSGLAYGIDTAAHRGALDAGGRTIAILGSGLRRIYPSENRQLAADITEQGAVVAEVGPDAAVTRQQLLARDRLQAAMSAVVVVVQCLSQCGSLVTAGHARAYGRGLVGFWWPDEPNAAGGRRLSRMGATMLEPGEIPAIVQVVESAIYTRPPAQEGLFDAEGQ